MSPSAGPITFRRGEPYETIYPGVDSEEEFCSDYDALTGVIPLQKWRGCLPAAGYETWGPELASYDPHSSYHRHLCDFSSAKILL